jgi:hypothetical protein
MMKKLFLLVVIVCFVPALAFSQASPYPPPGYPVEAFNLVDSVWVSLATADGNIAHPAAKAQCWASFPADSSCNKDWEISVKIHASIAQWCSWKMTGTRWDWFVKKPGDYAADCISGTIASNQNILVDYHGFGDLIALDTAKAVDDTIEVYYAIWGTGMPPGITNTAWVHSYDLNNEAEWDTVFDSEALHNGLTWKLWNRIRVSTCNSACEYQDDAFISLKLLCQKPWIDRETGFFTNTP